MAITHVPLSPLPPLGLGLARVGSFSNPSPLAESVALIRAALDLGVTLLDTANIYGQGDSERAAGRAIRDMRARATIVTKGGKAFSAKMRLLQPLKPLLRPLLGGREAHNPITAARAGAMREKWDGAALLAGLDGSLRRLGTDRVDVFLLHSPSAEVLAQAEPAETLARIHASGRAVRTGVACDDLAALDAALALPHLDVVELPWEMLAGLREGPRVAAITARGVAVIAREVLRGQPGVAPGQAFANARAHPLVASTLIGSRRLDRVRALARGEGA